MNFVYAMARFEFEGGHIRSKTMHVAKADWRKEKKRRDDIQVDTTWGLAMANGLLDSS